jgi:tRNA C32,U32 (ribose-2'-O)-methylase TrmJ
VAIRPTEDTTMAQPAYKQYTHEQIESIDQEIIDMVLEINKLSEADQKVMRSLLNVMSGKCKTENRCTLPR